ncbi:hypothetical protein BKA56DRAFT_63681 [Ilyonectria sp. MPI-CAGE-AT-0026]|nr:hypothetical protein BKA56DRAFT_63681 [Ilyonectria sp. MPI-CAGE-AT-0026]
MRLDLVVAATSRLGSLATEQPTDMASTASKGQRPNGWTRRIAKACDSCRRRRTKCSGTRPVCSQCTSTNANCHYSDRVDRQAGRPERYVAACLLLSFALFGSEPRQ